MITYTGIGSESVTVGMENPSWQLEFFVYSYWGRALVVQASDSNSPALLPTPVLAGIVTD